MSDPLYSIGFSTGNVEGNLDELRRRLEHFVGLGSTLTELTAVGLDAVSDCRLLPHRIELLRSVLSEYNLVYTLHGPIAVNLLDREHYDLHRRAALASVDLAAALGAEILVIHPGRAPQSLWETCSDQLLDHELDSMREIGTYAADKGVIVAFENMSPNSLHLSGQEVSYALDPARLAAMLDEVANPSVAACLDISHALQGSTLLGLDMLETVASLAPHVRHIHFSDSTGIPSDITWNNDGERLFMGIGDMHAPPEWGRIDFLALAQAINHHSENQHEGLTIAIELRSNHMQHSAAETLTAARQFAQDTMGAVHAQ